LVIDCGNENLFCEHAAYIYRSFSKEYERILPSITDKNMETDFHKIMNKIQTQIQKIESATIPERNTVSAPTTTRLLTPITNNIISSKGKPKRTSIKHRETYKYSPRVVETVAMKFKGRSKAEKMRGKQRSPFLIEPTISYTNIVITGPGAKNLTYSDDSIAEANENTENNENKIPIENIENYEPKIHINISEESEAIRPRYLKASRSRKLSPRIPLLSSLSTSNMLSNSKLILPDCDNSNPLWDSPSSNLSQSRSPSGSVTKTLGLSESFTEPLLNLAD